ncbi:MAG: phosphoenolpyruvate synthase [Candidatus Nanoarchaeia archaeon]
MAYCKWFKQLNRNSIPEAGGKGANLAEMWNAGFPVPPGFVVCANAYKEFLRLRKLDKKIEQMLANLDIEDTDKLQKVASEIQALIMSCSMPIEMQDEIKEFYEYVDTAQELKDVKSAQALLSVTPREPPYVAVRSSATAEDLPTASFAGQQATFLNVCGKEAVVHAVQACWASLFTPRAIYYRVKNNFPHMKVAIAVVVQKQINSDASGVMFSINPATNNPNQIVIEAAWGLGEAVVSGEVNPNTYILDKKNGTLIEQDIPGQEHFITRDPYTGQTIKKPLPKEKQKARVLTDEQIQRLWKLALDVEAHYGFPQDMEWAIEQGRLFLVQTRPVTTFKKEKIAEAAIPAEPILKGLGASPGIASGPVKIILSMAELDKVQKGDILVTTMTTPDFVPAMQRAAAIVTDHGGMTAHASIVSREMGKPCVVGTKTATQTLKDGQIITVDGDRGFVFEGEIKIEKKKEEQPTITPTQAPLAPLPLKTKVKVIIDLPDFAERAAQTNADGVGLLRLEGIIASGRKHPAKYLAEGKLDAYEELIYAGVKKIAEQFKDKPVWVRTSDIRTDEYRELEGGENEPKEANPMLGWHGIRRSLDQPELLKAELRALKRLVNEGFNIGVMFPFVISIEEVVKAKEIVKEVGLEPGKDIKIGIMIETPAAALLIEDFCKLGLDFISIGSNDLTQTILGVDRGNERIASLYSEAHPAVLSAMRHVIEVCKKWGVESSICGQAGSDPKIASLLIRYGIDSISANIDAVAKIKALAAELAR